MLKKFKVKNFKNFNEELELDLSRANNYEFNTEAVDSGILKDILVYGDNGSGKTNLGYALFDIIIHLTDKQRNLSSYRLYNCLSSKTKEPTSFEYTFAFPEGELVYSYQKSSVQTLISENVTIDAKEVIHYDYKSGKNHLDLEGAENLNIPKLEPNMSMVKYIYSNTVLSDDSNNNKVFKKFISFVNRMLWFSSLERNQYMGFQVGVESVAQGIIEKGGLEQFQKFLKDLGISYSLFAKDIEEEKKIYCRFEKGDVDFYSVASKGTSSLGLFFYWLIRMEEASLVFIDEFDAFYHNNLAEQVVRSVMGLPNTQGILTTHNTDIMSNELLRPDCYWQIVNGKMKSFADSTSKELRKAHNLQKMYNAGAFNE